MKNASWLLIFAALITSNTAIAQQKQFTTADLLANKTPKNFYNAMPTVVKWVDDDHVILNQKLTPDAEAKNYELHITTGTFTESSVNITPATRFGSTNATIGKSVYTKDNDLYLKINGVEKRLTNDKDEEKNATFSPDSNYIGYTKNNNLYTYNFKTGKEIKLTTDGSFTSLNGFASWVYYEEIFGRPTRYRAFWWSPDSKKLAYMHFDESMVPMFPIYGSDGQHGFLEQTRYPKVGDKNPETKVGFVNPNGGATVWANFNAKNDQYFGWPIWKPDSKSMIVQWINRNQDSLKLYDVNPATGAKKEFYTEYQKTWVDLEDGAGGRITFLDNKSGFILNSDKTGWNHLYLHNLDGTLKNAITQGTFTVLDVKLIDEKAGVIYFTARCKENSAHIDFYSVKMNGTDMKRLTFGDYNNTQISLSPNGKNFITTYSNVSTPTKMTLVDNSGKILKELGDAKGSEMANYAVAKTELIRIKSDDGLFELPAVVTWPTNYDATKKYPMLISIYGGPNAGTVMDTWNWSNNRQFYANEGLIQVAFDHRASGHFGKAGVNYMYHNLGYWEMTDYKTMAKWFIANGGADPKKICMTGFSYGGYMSCMAVTFGADVFTHAMAGGSVTDWTLYDSHYTEKFMGTPTNNAEGYKTSSVFSYIDNYKGVLQIVHGTIDDNVHLQNSLQLVAALQDKGKDFEMTFYPGGRHGWGNLPARNAHFSNLKTKFIYKYLLEKTVPTGLLR